MSQPVVLTFDAHVSVGPSRFGAGMNHRAEQIGELLAASGVDVRPVVADGAGVSKAVGMAWGARYLWGRGLWRPGQQHRVGRYGRKLVAYVAAIRAAGPVGCVLWGVPMDWIVPVAAGICGLPVLAAPVDLDALARHDFDVVTGRGLWPNLRLECDALIRAAACFCISREERWLLAALGGRVDWLPYQPAGEFRRTLAGVRATRETTPARHHLVLTSYSNPSNRTGVMDLFAMLAEPGHRPAGTVVVAGHDSQRFAGPGLPAGVRLAGTVSDAELTGLMAEARSLVVLQRGGSGALTRIPEALVAGIPVVCNGIAARSAHHYPGVHTFESTAELRELLAADLPTPPVPPRPVAAEERFVAAVRRLCGLPA